MSEKLFVTTESKLFIEISEWDNTIEEYHKEIHDITDIGYKYFFLPCRFEENVTLRQFLRLLRNYNDILSKLFYVYYYEEFMEYLLNSSHKNDSIEAIEIYEDITIDKVFHEARSDKEVHLCGFHLTQAQIDAKPEYEKSRYKTGDIENFGFIGIKKLNPDMKIKVRPKTHVHIQKEKFEDNKTLIFDDERGLTLIDIIHALFWEFSFYGSIEDQEAVNAELHESIEAVKNDPEGRTVPFSSIDDLMNDLNR